MKIQLSDHFTYKRLIRFVISPVIMMIFTSIYGVVDGLFVSNFVGKVPFAAVNLIMPFLMILGGMGFMLGTGGSALVSATMGLGEKESANKYFSMIIYLTIILGVLLTITGIVFIRPISKWLGATPAMLDDCISYGIYNLLFNVAFMLQNVFQSFLIVAEKPKMGLAVTVAAGLTNMILDALFIAVLKMGVIGAALATGISQCVGGILPLIYFFMPNSSSLRPVRTSISIRPMLNACSNGLSELMSNISASVVSVIYNFQLLKYAGENGVAVYGVLMYVQFIFVGLFVGYSIGSAPIVSYHFGAGNTAELKNMFKKGVILMLTCGLFMVITARMLSSPLSHIFVGYDRDLFDMTNHAFSIFSLSFLLSGFNIFASSFFTALNNGIVSASISFLRTLIFQILSVLILPVFFRLDGIWYAVGVAELFAAVVSVVFIIKKKKEYHYI